MLVTLTHVSSLEAFPDAAAAAAAAETLGEFPERTLSEKTV